MMDSVEQSPSDKCMSDFAHAGPGESSQKYVVKGMAGVRGSVRRRGQNRLIAGVKNKTKEHVMDLWNWLLHSGV